MKSTILKYIVIFFILFNISSVFATEKTEKFVGGEVSFELIDDDITEDENKLPFKEKVELLYEAAQYFEKNYPDEEIEGDISEDVQKFFPNADGQTLFKRGEQIRSGIRWYRKGKALVEYVKVKLFSPKEPDLIFDDDEYDINSVYEYVETPDDEALIITDIKKVVSYSGSKKDKDATAAKQKRDIEKKDRKNNLEKLYTIFSRISVKDVLLGGSSYSPFTGDMGMGLWHSNGNIKVRMLSDSSNIDDAKYVRFVFDFVVKDGYFVKYSSLKNNKYININFENSKNFTSYEMFYPAPYAIKLENEERIAGYVSSFTIPFVIEVSDINDDLELSPKISIELCNLLNECERVLLKPFIILEYGEGMHSVSTNYINNSFIHLPKEKNDNIRIEKIYINDEEGSKDLVIEYFNDYSTYGFEVFVENADGIEFEAPRVLVDGNKYVVKLAPKNPKEEIAGKVYSVTTNVNNIYKTRANYIPQERSFIDEINTVVPFRIILLALLSGLLINLIPSVFSVSMSRIISLSSYGGRNKNNILKSFSFNILGVLFSFIALFGIYLFSNREIYWGIQYNYIEFIIFSLVLTIVFIAFWQGLLKIKIVNFLMIKPNKIKDILIGVSIVFLSLIFVSPYFLEVLGFAHFNSGIEAIFVILCVFIGLVFPYLLFIFFPSLTELISYPNKSIKKIKKISIIMLLFQLSWLLYEYYVKVDAWALLRTIGYFILLYVMIGFRHYLLEEINTTILDEDRNKKITSRVKNVFIVLFVLLISIWVYDGVKSSTKEVANESNIEIDITKDKIREYIKSGKTVVVNVDSDWCLMCKYNNVFVFNNMIVREEMRNNNVLYININYSLYPKEAFEFMTRYNKFSIPFTIIYNRNFPEGVILSKFLTETEISKVFHNIRM